MSQTKANNYETVLKSAGAWRCKRAPGHPGTGPKPTKFRQPNQKPQLSSNQAKKQKLEFNFWPFSNIFHPNLAPRPAPTGQARKLVQNAAQISSGDQFEGHVVASAWSRPKKLKFVNDGMIAGKTRIIAELV